jgi:5'-hydroxyaverantin dehydrogenase
MSSDPELEKLRQVQENILQGTAKIDFDHSVEYAVLSGRTAIVTGGASGIGCGIVGALISHGARVAVLDLSWTSGSQTEEDCNENVKFFECDVSCWDSLLAAFKRVLLWSEDRLDIVVLSAGLRSHNIKDLVLDLNAERAPVKPPSAVFDVNLLGTYYTAYLALWYFTHLEPRRNGTEVGWQPQLLFLGSLASYVEQPLSADYCASKHGVRGLWKSVRAHGALFGDCQMNLLAPTFINNRQGSSKSRGGGSLTSSTNGIKMGEVADVVAGALRCLCDVNVDGRYYHCEVLKDDQCADLARSCVVLCQRRRRTSR